MQQKVEIIAQAAHPGAVPLVRALGCSKWGCCYSKDWRLLTCCITQEGGSSISLVFLSSPLSVSLISQGSNGLSVRDSLRELWSELYRVGNATLHVIFSIAIRYSQGFVAPAQQIYNLSIKVNDKGVHFIHAPLQWIIPLMLQKRVQGNNRPSQCK